VRVGGGFEEVVYVCEDVGCGYVAGVVGANLGDWTGGGVVVSFVMGR